MVYLVMIGVHSSCGAREPASGVVRDASLLRVSGASPQTCHDFSAHSPAESVWKVSQQDRGGGAGGSWGLSPPLLKVGALIYRIAPPTLYVPKIFCRALFGAI